MRSDRDQRSGKEKEIDDFLAQFERPVDEVSNADVINYLDTDTVFKWVDTPITSEPAVNAEPVKPVEIVKTAESAAVTETSAVPAENKLFGKKKKDIAESPANGKEAANDHLVSSVKKNSKAIKEKIRKTDKKKLAEFLFLKDNPNYDPTKESTYMLAGKKVKNSPKVVSVKKIIRDCIGFFVLLMICGLLYALGCIIMAPGINPHDIYSSVATSSMVYDDDGQHVDSIFYTENRKITKYEEMPEELINSFVAIEDKTFWKHHGFNWTRMVGAVLSSVVGRGRISGTSTITQQLARNVYLADTKSVRSIKRKLLEMYYAARIEGALSKEEIVEAYLNTIYLGYGCYGVDAAAKAYFSKSVKDLDLLECASLAALPQAPEDYALLKYLETGAIPDENSKIITSDDGNDSYVTNDVSKDRRDLTLALMKDQGYITDADYNKYAGTDLADFIKPTLRTTGAGAYSYFHEYLVDTIISDLMEQYDMEYADAERMVYTQGLKIYSTMDSTAQKVAVKELKDNSNFPGISGMYDQDSDGNIVNGDMVLLYNYDNFFNDKDNFVLSGNKVSINSDGSVTIKDSERLNVYTTTVAEGTDYSLEFKNTYKIIDGTLYSFPGGYINVPMNYKSLDESGNLVISADFFTDYPDLWKVNKKDNKVTITSRGYSLAQKTVQPQSAMVIVGVGTGEVKAMVGGRTTRGERLLNRALNSRQPGSSIKPLAVYGAALQKSFELQKEGKKWDIVDFGIDKQGKKGYGSYITTYSSVADERCHIEGREWPKNANDTFTGKNTFMTAIQQSINTCAVKIQLQVGAPFSAQMLEKFGLSTIVTDESQANNDMNPSALGLGGMVNGVIPLEMALAYASFPAGGKVNTPICYTKVVDREGNVLLEGKSEQSEVMDEGVAWIMTEVLKTVVTKGIAGAAAISGVQAGGKTGTTNDQYDIWFDGFTPNYAASLWIGTDNNIKMSTMSGPAARLWGRIMNQIPKAKQGTYRKQPANVIFTNGCYFTKGTEIGLDKYAPEDKKLVKKVDAYFESHDCTIEEACKACGTTYDEYKDAGGTVAKGTTSPFVIEQARQEAYQAWLTERENHKTWISNWVEEEKEVKTPIYGDDTTKPIYKEILDEEGNPTGEKEFVGYEQKIVDYEIKKEIQKVDKGHWEYEDGYRKGQFKFTYKE